MSKEKNLVPIFFDSLLVQGGLYHSTFLFRGLLVVFGAMYSMGCWRCSDHFGNVFDDVGGWFDLESM